MSERSETPPIGILGGTFDPVHYGHLRLAEEARITLGLERILWIPAGKPPHRSPPHVAARHRVAMVRLAIAGNPGFVADEGEARSDAPSYSVTTLERLRNQYGPERALVLLLGSDAFAGLTTWHRWRELFALSHLAVATRPGYALEAEQMADELADEFRARMKRSADLHQAPAGAIVPFTITALGNSGTTIRGALAGSGSARYLLPDPVLDYISEHRLYQDPANKR